MTDPNIIANAQPGDWFRENRAPYLVVRTEQPPNDPCHWKRVHVTTGGTGGYLDDTEVQKLDLIPLRVKDPQADSDDVDLLNLTADMLEAVGIAEDTDYDAPIARIRARAARIRARAARIQQEADPDYRLAREIAEDWAAQEAMNLILDTIRRAKAGAR